MHTRLLALPLVLLPFLAWLGAADSDLDTAREHFESEDYEATAELLSALVASEAGNAEAHELLASALLRLERADEAAHHLATAFELFTDEGEVKVTREIKARLYRVDPHARSRDKLFERIVKDVVDSAEKLAEKGSPERGLELLAGVVPIARGKGREAAQKLYEQLASAFEQVDLTAAGSSGGEGDVMPLHEASSVRYEMECNLEPEVVQLIGETMDSIYDYYVSLYFDGDDSEIKEHRATIRIFGNKPDMDDHWEGDDPPYGWWSPGRSEVVCFDTRTQGGSLDPLLDTLFHEASHQFMTLMSKGGRAPTWLNEGTSCFFEGAVAMADNRVLWPDAALGRLRSLKHMLENKMGPTPRQVIEFAEGGSYPGEYYSFGWGFVYYLQQYEDPDTLEYVYRPLYAEYRDTVTTRESVSMRLFEKTFLGKDSPRGHKTFEDFEEDWRDWILNRVAPLHFASLDARRELRLAEVERYLAAAGEAQGKKRAKVSEEELLRRALGHLEYIRTRIDKAEAQDPELLLRQATILERLGFKRTAAPLLEEWLNLADSGSFEADEEIYKEVGKRLKAIDSKNYELRRIRNKIAALINRSRRLLVKYEKDGEFPLRSYTFIAQVAAVFPSDESLAKDVERLKRAARDAGVLRGSVRSLLGSEVAWRSCIAHEPDQMTSAEDSLALADNANIVQLNTDVELSGEYELRATLERDGWINRGGREGLIIAGTPTGNALLVGINSDNELGVWQITSQGEGPTRGTSTSKIDTYELSVPPPTAKDTKTHKLTRSPVSIVVHVFDETNFTVTLGESQPIEIELDADIPSVRNAGVFLKDGRLTVTDFVVEVFL